MPTSLNQYTLGRTLGSGVSCKVKLAKNNLGKRFAIKIIHSDQSFQELIDTEVQALAQLRHTNIVQLVEVNQGQQINPKKGAKDVQFIVLELVGGGELFDFVALGGRLPEPTARHFFRQLLDGLGFMHSRGYAHRDLKPENILLDKEFTLKITDLGFAAPMAGRDNSGLLQTQLGTASYMAPEIHLGKKYDGARVDLFAAAIILFVIMTQRPPFSSANPNDPHYRLIAAGRAKLFWQAHAEAESGEDIYSEEFKDFFEKMMAMNPNQRPTMEQILAHPFMQGDVPSMEAIRQDFIVRKSRVDGEAHTEREAKRQKRHEASDQRQAAVVHRNGNHDCEEGEEVVGLVDAWQSLEIQEYGPYFVQDFTQFFTTSRPLDYFADLVRYVGEQQRVDYRISGSNLRLKFVAQIGEGQTARDANVDIQLLRVNEHKHCVKFTYRDPVTKVDLQGQPDTLLHFCSLRSAPELSMFCDTTFDEQSNSY